MKRPPTGNKNVSFAPSVSRLQSANRASASAQPKTAPEGKRVLQQKPLEFNVAKAQEF